MGKAAEPSVEPRPAFPLSNQLTFGRSRTYDIALVSLLRAATSSGVARLGGPARTEVLRQVARIPPSGSASQVSRVRIRGTGCSSHMESLSAQCARQLGDVAARRNVASLWCRTEVESFAEVLRLGQAADLVQRQRLRQEGRVSSTVGMPQPLVAATTTAEHTPVIK